jgi:hypothetical protein
VVAKAFDETLGNSAVPNLGNWPPAVTAFADRIVQLGKAETDDKTMVDALLPFAAVTDHGVHGDGPALQSLSRQGAGRSPRAGRARGASEPTNVRKKAEEQQQGQASERKEKAMGLRLIVGANEAGAEYKDRILEDLRQDPRVSEVTDIGVNRGDAHGEFTRPYPFVGIELARRLAKEWIGYTFDPDSASAGKVEVLRDFESC